MSNDILREVDAAMRADKAMALWRDHGKTIMAIGALIILATALYSGWKMYAQHQQRQQTAQLVEAFKSAEPMDALTKLAREGKGNSKSLASLAAAAIAVDKQDWNTAIAMYDAVAADRTLDSLFRDQAIVQSVALQMDNKPEVAGQDLLDQLAPLLNAKGAKSMWAPRARVLSALIKAHELNDFEGAIADLDALLATSGVPADILDQARMMRDVYSVKLAEHKS